jgi:predicted CXXCH cytochrome family protein
MIRSLLRPITRVPKNALLFGGLAAWSVLLVSCAVGGRTLLVPSSPQVAGATVVGSERCTKCHTNISRGFHDATHARLIEKGADGKNLNVACESCHGPGSQHIRAGTRDTIINPKNSPETCLQCHVNARAEFSLPHTHPVLAGKITCTACHDPHQGDANQSTAGFGGARHLATALNQACMKCHPAQSGPFTFEHEVMREGCVTCHSPHGSVNDKMLRSRNVSLCYQCHFQPQNSTTSIVHGGVDHSNNVIRGTCWSAGCHEAVHGSHVNSSLRY